MGTWGPGSFENDTASDWVWGLEKAQGTEYLEAAFNAVLDVDGYLESPEAEAAIAAAEVLAALKGEPSADLPEDVPPYVERIAAAPTGALVELALKALERIKAEESELQELWEETGDASEWEAVLDSLEQRLR